MIVQLKKGVSADHIVSLSQNNQAFHVRYESNDLLVMGSGVKELPKSLEESTDQFWVFPNDMQLSSKHFKGEKRQITIGNTVIGGASNNTLVIAGPCSVESEAQLTESAHLLKRLGLTTLRGGCYKPRTSPYSFQGLGLEGLKLLQKMREEFGLQVITEARDATHIEEVIAYTDIIQIGAKAMYDQGILRACAKTTKPVLIKRGFGTTLQELVQAAEFVLSGGNENVMVCERGLRTFETGTRFTLDLCGVAWLQEKTNLPVVLDPSHAMGYAYGVPSLTRACTAMGIDGLLIEVHPDPSVAKSDASQQLNHHQFEELLTSLHPVAQSVGYNLV
jgi:3-deoxy-7-phosphoheptulonate synthase